MDELVSEELDFVLGWCRPCAREVLTYVDPNSIDTLRACVSCDEPVVEQLRVTRGYDLAEVGYTVLGEGGCGGGCAAGACGRR